MNIEEIAIRIDGKLSAQGLVATSAAYAIAFAHALLAELSKDEPVAICDTNNRIRWNGNDDSHRYSSAPNNIEVGTKLFTHPANTAEIEQRVAEAIAKMTEKMSKMSAFAKGVSVQVAISESIRSGKWREYL